MAAEVSFNTKANPCALLLLLLLLLLCCCAACSSALLGWARSSST
jgi:hypothetical protein